MGPLPSAETLRQRLVPFALVAATLGGVSCAEGIDQVKANPATTTEATSTTNVPTTTEVTDACEDSWAMTGLDHGQHRVDVNGMSPEARASDTEEEARDALGEWLDSISTDERVLAGAATEILGIEVTAADLVDGECASDRAVEVKAQLETAIAFADVAPGEVPADSTNTGVNEDGDLVASDSPGISGDRSGIIVDIDGEATDKDFAILYRCKNPVFPRTPGLPKGPTDEPEITPTPTTLKDKTPVPRTHDAHPQPGAGGDPERGMNPEDDTDETGYDNEGDVPTLTVPQTTSPNVTVPPSPNTTGAPRPTETSVPVTTQVPRPTTPPPTLGD